LLTRDFGNRVIPGRCEKDNKKIKGLRVRLLRGVVEDVCACECENRMPFLKMQVFIQEIYDHSIVKNLNQWF